MQGGLVELRPPREQLGPDLGDGAKGRPTLSDALNCEGQIGGLCRVPHDLLDGKFRAIGERRK
eukprot:10502502-Lingulodinium_polyedra.AAC.1